MQFETRFRFGSLASPASRTPSRLEWVVATSVATACAIVVLVTSKNLWFFSDTWAMLATRRLTEIDGWVRPHGGHWFVPSTFMAKALLRTVGAESFYPWYFLPRVVLYGLLSLAWWRVLRWRDVGPGAALAVLVFISWLGVSGWMITVSYTGTIVVCLAALGAAWLIDSGDERTWHQVALFVCLTGALCSSGSGTAVWAATALVALMTRRLRTYWLPIAASGTIYALWFIFVAQRDSSPLKPSTPGLRDIVLAPVEMWKLAAGGLSSTFDVGSTFGHLLAVIGLAGLVALAASARLRPFDVTIILAGVIILSLGVLVRGSQGVLVAAPNRLYLVAAYILLGIVGPALTGLRGRFEWGIAAVVLVLSVGQLTTLLTEIDNRERYMSAARPRVETAVALITEGHPYIPWTGPSPQAHHGFLAILSDHGLPARVDPAVLADTTQTLKHATFANGSSGGTALGSAGPIDAEGCADLAGGETLQLDVLGNGTMVVRDAAGASLRVTRSGDADFSTDVFIENDQYGLAYAGPFGVATLSLQGDWSGTRQVCGLANID